MLVLGLESSCDETAAALVEDGRKTRAGIIASQADLHSRFGGVVPEIASRKHVEAIIPVIDSCLSEASVGLDQVDAFAVTAGPGLVGALLIALTAAKALSAVCHKPLYAVHHLAGHIAANYLAHEDLEPPFIALIVSGGHSHIVHVKTYTEFEILARTRDDAAGEAFDKVARVLGLGYPGGPAIDRAARDGSPLAYHFPSTRFPDGSLDFSFSGLKTHALGTIHRAEQCGERLSIADFAASFQYAIVTTLVEHTLEAARRCQVKQIVLAGGVAANRSLREIMAKESAQAGLTFFCPSTALCTDNAEMIAAAGFYLAAAGRPPAGPALNARPSWPLNEAWNGE